jgi:hypothetical protein
MVIVDMNPVGGGLQGDLGIVVDQGSAAVRLRQWNNRFGQPGEVGRGGRDDQRGNGTTGERVVKRWNERLRRGAGRRHQA